MIRKNRSFVFVLAVALTQLLPSVGRSAEGKAPPSLEGMQDCFNTQFKDHDQCYSLAGLGFGLPGPNEVASRDSVARQVNGFCDSIQDRHVLCEDRENTTELFYELSKVSKFMGPFPLDPATDMADQNGKVLEEPSPAVAPAEKRSSQAASSK